MPAVATTCNDALVQPVLCPSVGPCVINVYINYERKFAFVELRTGEAPFFHDYPQVLQRKTYQNGIYLDCPLSDLAHIACPAHLPCCMTPLSICNAFATRNWYSPSMTNHCHTAS